LKKTLSILFVFLILLSTLVKVWTYFDFLIHQKEIAETLCVEKDKEVNTCNGKCHLTTQLQEVEQTDKPIQNQNKKEEIQIHFFFVDEVLSVNLHGLFKNIKNLKYFYQYFYSNPFYSSILKPPIS
jgi:hypothetical protein